MNYEAKDQVPLYNLNADVKIENNIAELKYKQFYFHHSDKSIESEYPRMSQERSRQESSSTLG